jgi:prenyltransferase beta subunit
MLQVARLAPRMLGESTALVLDYLRSQHNPDGGFADRAGQSDLYYSVFGLEGLLALRADVPFARVREYVQSFGDGAELDFVHLACLARCWANLPAALRHDLPADALTRRAETFRTRDGGYSQTPGADDGTVYGCFLALGTYQDCAREIPNLPGLFHCIDRLKAEDGGYANQLDVPHGLTPSTAAAITLLRQFQQPIGEDLAEWMLERHSSEGGFFATPIAPIPDLLSTATALHALSGMHVNLDPIREPCLDFIDSLWTSQGGFHGTWTDDTLDVEYTYYGLLALGHLTV